MRPTIVVWHHVACYSKCVNSGSNFFFNLHLLWRRKALNNCLIIDLIIFPFFYEFFLFKLYIHSLFTFYSSPQVKVNMINMSKKKKITWINVLSLGELCWNHQRVKSRNELCVKSLMSRLTLKWDKCLENLKLGKEMLP